MSYRSVLSAALQRQIVEWHLPDSVYVSISLFLREELPARPSRHLTPSDEDRGGMICEYAMIDPANRFLEHRFEFRVYYRPDETTPEVSSGTYRREYPW